MNEVSRSRSTKKYNKIRTISEIEFWVFSGILLATILEGKVGNMRGNESSVGNQGHNKSTSY